MPRYRFCDKEDELIWRHLSGDPGDAEALARLAAAAHHAGLPPRSLRRYQERARDLCERVNVVMQAEHLRLQAEELEQEPPQEFDFGGHPPERRQKRKLRELLDTVCCKDELAELELLVRNKRLQVEEEELEKNTRPDCSICHESGIQDAVVMECGHCFCNGCLIQYLLSATRESSPTRHKRCPLCRRTWIQTERFRVMPQGASVFECKRVFNI